MLVELSDSISLQEIRLKIDSLRRDNQTKHIAVSAGTLFISSQQTRQRQSKCYIKLVSLRRDIIQFVVTNLLRRISSNRCINISQSPQGQFFFYRLYVRINMLECLRRDFNRIYQRLRTSTSYYISYIILPPYSVPYCLRRD